MNKLKKLALVWLTGLLGVLLLYIINIEDNVSRHDGKAFAFIIIGVIYGSYKVITKKTDIDNNDNELK